MALTDCFDGIDRRDVDDKECNVDADEHDQHELPKAPQEMQQESPHVTRLRRPAPVSPGQFAPVGFSFTIMTREFAQFGTGSVYGSVSAFGYPVQYFVHAVNTLYDISGMSAFP